MKLNNLIPSVNFHLWEPCNMRCKFCFATFQDVKQSILPKGHLPKNEAIAVVQKLVDFGFQKITFAGGEPTLCPWLTDLLKTAKQGGLTTMIVTNGSKLSLDFLKRNKPFLDWIAISIDSLSEATNLDIGRAVCGKRVLTEKDYLSTIEQIKQYGYRLKINTVVNQKNYLEDMNSFLLKASPERWKVLQVLPIQGQNDKYIDSFSITPKEFEVFLKRHSTIDCIVPESNTQIKGSYLMIDPAGRFFDNIKGFHRYSLAINLVGVENALIEMDYDLEKFTARGGNYDW